MDTAELHDRLHRIADRTAPEPADAASVVRAVAARSRVRRRQTAGVLAVAAAVAAVVVAVPHLVHGDPAVPAPGHVATPAPAGTVLSRPTRGSLAGDEVFVEAVRRLPWTRADDPDAPTAQAEPPLETRHVVLAADVPGGRWALVVSGDSVLWFAGPPGAAAGDLQPAQLSTGVDGGAPVALTDAATGTLVVVAAPGDAIAVSRGPEIAADATVSRDWEDVVAPDGVAVTTLSPATTMYDEAVRYRVTRGGAEVATAQPPAFRTSEYEPPAPSLTWLRGTPDPDVTAALASTAADTLTRTGLSPAEVPFTVVWSGDVPGSDGPGTQLSLLTATLPSGATYTEAWLTRSVAGGTQPVGMCGSELRAAGTPPVQQPFAVRCAPDDLLAVVAPSTATTARLLDDAGLPAATYDLDGGVAVVTTAPGAARVQLLGADGGVLDERPLMGRVDLGRR